MSAHADGATPPDALASRPRLSALARRLGSAESLDAPAERIAASVRKNIPNGPVKDALSGTWLGHAFHPLMTDVPIGTWTSAIILDWVGGRESAKAADRLIGVGLVAAVPTIASGWSDWADSTLSSDDIRRVGLVHAALNATATNLFLGSLIARRRGRRGTGKLLGLAAISSLGAGGWLGGHLSYSQASGVDQTALEEGPGEWSPALREDELAEGSAACAHVDDVRVLLVRQGGRVWALANRCTHRGGPLHEGEVGDGTITCPWHQSTFALADGSVRRGPAAYPQPAYDVRSRDGMLEVRVRAE
ncbi:MAG: Rieske 2Fe-2S domain-containing protein [Solirubrobacterales bacterium]|nr:Rieske 2Fe-2S domain-containing protein [Solirubrobacterales bacterium]